MSDFFSLWTNTGLAKQAAAEQSGTQIQVSHMAFGDGNGADIVPVATMTALVNEVDREPRDLVYVDQTNPNWVRVTAKIPMAAGPWWIREVGLIDADGDLIVIANYPAVFKPILSQGAAKDLYIEIIIAMSNTALIELTVDPSVVMASRAYVDAVMADLNLKLDALRRRAYFYAETL